MKIKKLFDKPKKLLLFFLLLYAIIPYETISNPILSYLFHLSAICGIVVFSLYNSNLKFKMNPLAKFTMLFLIFAITINSMVSFGLNEFLLFTSIVFGAITASNIYYNSDFQNLFTITFKWFIIFSVLMLFLQLIVLNTTGNILRIHELFFPFSEARIGFFGLFKRLGGLYIEPGTYSNWMHLFLIFYMVISGSLNNFIFYLVSISMILSLSAYGVIVGIYLLIILIMTNIKRSSWKKKLMALFLITIVAAPAMQYAIDNPAIELVNSKSNDGSGNLRRQAYQKFFGNIEDYFIIGEGFSNKFGEGIQSIQDSGLLLNLTVALGIVFSTIIISIYIVSFVKSGNFVVLLASLPLFVSKINYYEYSFWLLFFLVLNKSASHRRIQRSVKI